MNQTPQKVLLPAFYLPPASWFSAFLNADEAVIEQHENLPKQTYRNRANIYGANGRLALIIPIRHNGSRSMHRILASEVENWRALHWKSIKTAYQSSPYFEFYEDKLQEIFKFNENLLLDFNLNALNIILNILKVEKAYRLTETYQKIPTEADFRDRFSAKKPPEYHGEGYFQVFSDRYGFLPDLSVLDVLCNLGPQTLDYLKNYK